MIVVEDLIVRSDFEKNVRHTERNIRLIFLYDYAAKHFLICKYLSELRYGSGQRNVCVFMCTQHALLS
jgi:hypothetical protein